jgi:hypothetical protein
MYQILALKQAAHSASLGVAYQCGGYVSHCTSSTRTEAMVGVVSGGTVRWTGLLGPDTPAPRPRGLPMPSAGPGWRQWGWNNSGGR